MSGAVTPLPDGIRLRVRVTPGAVANRMDGLQTRDDGTEVLSLRVRAVPERGRANAAVVALVAGLLGLPPSALAIESGAGARIKTIRASGDPAALQMRLLATLSRPSR